MDLSNIAVEAPPTPSKWDIIPIHTSDRATFKQCRRKWAWSSPSQLNLVPKASINGIVMPLWFGTGIHHALEHYYTPGLQEDPALVFEAWFNLQWEGGTVLGSELREFLDRNPRPTGQFIGTLGQSDYDPFYAVSGLKDIMPDPDWDVFMEHKDLGIGMMTFYKDYAKEHDNFAVISTEHDFSVPVFDIITGEPLYMVDTRVMPESWEPDFSLENSLGPLMRYSDSTVNALEQRGVRMSAYDGAIEKQVHARGRMDMIVQDLDSGMYGTFDHKTAATIGDDYFRHLDLDEQCTTYLAAARIEARMHSLPYEDMKFITYQALRKNYPTAPTMTTKGLPSLDRQKEGTTAALFEKCIKDNNLQIVFDGSEKMQAYYTYLMEKGDDMFIVRTPTHRNRNQLTNAWKRVYLEALDMLDSPRIYPNPTKDYSCLNCQFRAPCIATEDGSDWQNMISDGYESNHDR